MLETNDVHDLEETVIKAASCSVAGEGIKACSRCNYSEPCVYEQLAHTYVNGTSYPGYCTIEGSQQQICTVCGTERWLKTAKTNTHQWIDTGLYSPDICVLCYQ